MNNRKKNIGAGFILSYTHIVLSSIVGLFFTPFLIKSLGTDEYGLYQLMYSAVGYLTVLDLGLGGTLTRFILKAQSENDKQKEENLIKVSFMIYFCLSAIIAIIGIVFSFFIDKVFTGTVNSENIAQARLLFLVMVLSACITLYNNAYTGIFTAYERYIFTKSLLIFKDISRVVIICTLLFIGMKSTSVVITDLIIATVYLISDIIYARFKLKKRVMHGKFDKSLVASIFSFTTFVVLQIFVTQINTSVDRVLLGRYSTAYYVGLYATSMQLFALFNSVSAVLSNITLPQVSRKVFSNPSREELSKYCGNISRIQFAVITPIFGALLLYGEQFCNIWVGHSYNPINVWGVLMLILSPYMFEFIELPLFNVMKAENKQATRSIILTLVTISNVALSVVFIKIVPVYGAALATTITFVLGNVIACNIFYHKKINVNIFTYYKTILHRMLPAWLISIAAGYAIKYIPGQGIVNFGIKVIAYVSVYSLSMLLLGLNSNEKSLIKNLLNSKVLSKIKR